MPVYINDTLFANGAFPLTQDKEVKGTPLIQATLTDLKNYDKPLRLTVGQLGLTSSDNKIYFLQTIGSPPTTQHTWLEFTGSGGTGDITGTLTSGKIPVATDTKTIGDSVLTQVGNDITTNGNVNALNTPTTNQKAAMSNAFAPSSTNPFITQSRSIAFINDAANKVGRAYNGKPLYLSTEVIYDLDPQDLNPKIFFPVFHLTEVEKPSTEKIIYVNITQNSSSDFIAGFKLSRENHKTAGVLGGVIISKLWGLVSRIDYTTYITGCTYHIKKYVGETLTTTGSGTTRIVTPTNFPFVYPVNSNKKLAPYLETPTGVFQIIGSGGVNFVTINTPADYENETNVPFNQWIKISEFNTGGISQTISHEITCFSEPEDEYSIFTGADWGEDDDYGTIFFADTNSASDIIKVDLIWGGPSRYSHVDIHGFLQVKSSFTPAETSTSFSARRSRTVSGTGQFNFNFKVPNDARKVLDAYVIGYPSFGAAGAGKTISKLAEYNNNEGEDEVQYSASVVAESFDLTEYANKRWHLSFIDQIGFAKAGCEGGVAIDHVSVDANIDYTGTEILYI